MYAPHTVDEACGASPAQQNPLHVKVEQIRGCNRIARLQEEDYRDRAVARAESRDRSRGLPPNNAFRQDNYIRTVGIQGAHKVSFARTARRYSMTGRVQNGLNSSCCDLVSSADDKPRPGFCRLTRSK